MDDETHLHCADCRMEWEVSTEDPDSTLSDAFDHVGQFHPRSDPYTCIRPGRTWNPSSV